MRHLPVIFIIFAVFAVMACDNKPPMGIMSYDRMKSLLYDYHLALQLARQSPDSSTQYSHLYTEAVLRKHGVTRADFDSSLLWYARRTEILYKLYGELQQEIDEEARLLGNASGGGAMRYAHLSRNGDTANIWQGAEAYILTTAPMRRTMTFSMQADSTFLPGDRFLWHFNNHFVYSSGRREAIANFVIRYDNDSISSSTARIMTDGDYEIVLTSAERPIKEIFGSIHHHVERGDKERILCVTFPSLIRFHKERPVETPASDTLAVDTLALDSLSLDLLGSDSLRVDSIPVDTLSGHKRKHRAHILKRDSAPKPASQYKRF